MAVTYDSNADLIKGDDIFVFTGAADAELPTAFGTSANLSLSKDTIDTANKMTGGWAAGLDGRKNWTMTSDALLTKKTGASSFDSLFDAFISSTPVRCVYGKADASFDLDAGWYTGNARITALEQTAEQNGVVSCTVTFTGTGALTKVAVV